MGFFDFIFGNKKKAEQERLERERQAELQRKENERIAREREARLAEAQRKEAERKAQQEALRINKPIINELDIRHVASGYPFETDLYVSVVKQHYGGQSSVIPTTKGATAKVIRKSQGSNIEIIFSNLSELKSKGLIQSNLSLSPQFDYNRDGDGDEFASAEINNSFAAMTSGKEYISLFQITKQKGNVISFLINNLPGVGEYYYLIVLDSRKPQ